MVALEKERDILFHTVPMGRRSEKEDFFEWKKHAKSELSRLLGMDKLVPCEANYQEIEREENEDFSLIRFRFESEKDYYVHCYLGFPKKTEGKVPLTVCLQGHGKGAHASFGRTKYEGEVFSGGDRDFALQILSHGMVALAIEQRNFGECGGSAKGPNCYTSAMTALLLGRTTIGERVFDVSRALDLVLDRFGDRIDEKKIACMGNSGGGTATLYAACLDDRIAAAMPSCAVSTYHESIAKVEHCACNFVPSIALHFDMGDLLGMVAPRPLVVVSGKQDMIFPIESARECFALAKDYYRAAGAEENCAMVEGEEGHRFYAAPAWTEFLKRFN